MSRIACTDAGESPVSANAWTRRSARPTRSRTVEATAASSVALVTCMANRTPTPSATPMMVRTVRTRRAARLRQASEARLRTG